MSGLQTIIDYSNGLQIDRRKVVGIQYTRNEIPRVSQTPTTNPWKFTIQMPTNFRYNEARALLEELDTLDRITPQVITFSNRPEFSWMFAYQGTMSQTAINNLRVVSYTTNQLVLTNLPVIPSGRVLFEKNDLIQIGNHTFPCTSTTRVTRGTGATVTVTTSRPNIISTSVVGDGITVGNACEFYMFCPNMPTYKLFVGGQQGNSNGTLINNALIEWSEAFEFYEQTGAA